jgi:thiol-disulfide isomerase/thioredoxin
MKTTWKKVKGPIEFLLWAAVLTFLFIRLAPQITPMLGVAEGDEELSAAAFQGLDGTVYTAADLEGKVVLLNIWATWCGPCVIEMPSFQKIYDDYKDQGFLILGVSKDHEGPEKVKAFLERKEITYPVAMAANVDFGDLTVTSALPTSYLIGKDGTVRNKVTGLYVGPALRMAVKRLLAEE